MVTVMKRAYTPRYDYRYLAAIKRYFTRHPGATTNACAKALQLQWHTVKRYRERLGVLIRETFSMFLQKLFKVFRVNAVLSHDIDSW